MPALSSFLLSTKQEAEVSAEPRLGRGQERSEEGTAAVGNGRGS